MTVTAVERSYLGLNALGGPADGDMEAARLGELVAHLEAARLVGQDRQTLFDLLHDLHVDSPDELLDLLKVVASQIARGALCYSSGHLELGDLMASISLWNEDAPG